MICSCTVFVKLCVSFLAHHWDEEFMPQNAPKAHPTDPTGHGSLSQGPARAVRAPYLLARGRRHAQLELVDG